MSETREFTEIAGKTVPEHLNPDTDIPLYQLLFWIGVLLAAVAIVSEIGI